MHWWRAQPLGLNWLGLSSWICRCLSVSRILEDYVNALNLIGDSRIIMVPSSQDLQDRACERVGWRGRWLCKELPEITSRWDNNLSQDLGTLTFKMSTVGNVLWSQKVPDTNPTQLCHSLGRATSACLQLLFVSFLFLKFCLYLPCRIRCYFIVKCATLSFQPSSMTNF